MEMSKWLDNLITRSTRLRTFQKLNLSHFLLFGVTIIWCAPFIESLFVSNLWNKHSFRTFEFGVPIIRYLFMAPNNDPRELFWALTKNSSNTSDIEFRKSDKQTWQSTLKLFRATTRTRPLKVSPVFTPVTVRQFISRPVPDRL